MLKPIGMSGGLSVGADSMFAQDMPTGPVGAIEAARQLHELLFDDVTVTGDERRVLARQISGHLFAAESDRILPDGCRAFFRRLRTDAYQRAASIDPKRLPLLTRIGAGYDKLENGLRFLSET
jgi:hypothetical protein